MGGGMAMAMPPTGGGMGMPPPSQAQPSGPECRAEFLVLNEHAGHLIGKGGSVINEFRGQSGAKIDMQRSEPGMTERVLTIVGSIQQCVSAQHLIAVKLASVLTQLSQFQERDSQPANAAYGQPYGQAMGAPQGGYPGMQPQYG